MATTRIRRGRLFHDTTDRRNHFTQKAALALTQPRRERSQLLFLRHVSNVITITTTDRIHHLFTVSSTSSRTLHLDSRPWSPRRPSKHHRLPQRGPIRHHPSAQRYQHRHANGRQPPPSTHQHNNTIPPRRSRLRKRPYRSLVPQTRPKNKRRNIMANPLPRQTALATRPLPRLRTDLGLLLLQLRRRNRSQTSLRRKFGN